MYIWKLFINNYLIYLHFPLNNAYQQLFERQRGLSTWDRYAVLAGCPVTNQDIHLNGLSWTYETGYASGSLPVEAERKRNSEQELNEVRWVPQSRGTTEDGT